MCDELELTDHAVMRMRERDISMGQIRRVLKGATIEMPGTKEGTRKVWGKVDGKSLCAVVKPLDANSKKCLVVSVWWRD